MAQSRLDSYKARKILTSAGKNYNYFDLNAAALSAGFDLKQLPFSLRILFENMLRFEDGFKIKKEDITVFATWLKTRKSEQDILFSPARVLMQDFTGVPAVVDLATMRDAAVNLGIDPQKINPQIPVDLVIDHSVIVDKYATNDSYQFNVKKETERNRERYEFLKWGQGSFRNFRVVPPGTGICHQVNLEYLANVVWKNEENGEHWLYPDTVVGTDSHTTMVNGLSVLGWGVGGIEAEAAMLGQPISMGLPEVIGFEVFGKMNPGTTATDFVLTVTNILRQKGVVNKFVEFFGEGLKSLSVADRATVSNMSPEYGATCGYFPIDGETLKYLKLSGRSNEHIELVEQYAKAVGLWHTADAHPLFTDIVKLDLGSIEPCLAGPKRPQDKVILGQVSGNFEANLASLNKNPANQNNKYNVEGHDFSIQNGDVVIAAITSCTNTSNPAVMIGAGLIAKKANKLGLKTKPWVKTSLAPGSKVVTDYLNKSGLQKELDVLGFNLVGYGCTTCIGNSGPLKEEIEKTITENNLVVASVLSGNRNFEGRIHPLVRANYLASPMLCVVFALVGDIRGNIMADPIGQDKNGNTIYLKDIWPSMADIEQYIGNSLNSSMFEQKYSDVFKGEEEWRNLRTVTGATYSWDNSSTYIKKAPYFDDMTLNPPGIKNVEDAKLLAVFGDSITTDHISPAGSIAKTSPAAKYLNDHSVQNQDFNSYGSRRGNHEVMIRGTFANIRIKNELLDNVEGGLTKVQGSDSPVSIFDAAELYKSQGYPTIIIAGKEYGTGSSRDWAAKGPLLQGVRAVIAESFERIHRSNLVGMGIIPFVFINGMTRADLKLKGDESFSFGNLKNLKAKSIVPCQMKRANGEIVNFDLLCRVDTDFEVDYLNHGGILHYVLRNMA